MQKCNFVNVGVNFWEKEQKMENFLNVFSINGFNSEFEACHHENNKIIFIILCFQALLIRSIALHSLDLLKIVMDCIPKPFASNCSVSLA